MDPHTDEELIVLHLEGDTEAFALLLKRHLDGVYNFAQRLGGVEDTDDIVQETFLKVWKNLARFKSEHSQFRTWLYSITRNTTIDFLRKKKSLLFSDFEGRDGANVLTDTLPDQEPLPDELFAQAQNEELLKQALENLPPRAREVLLLRYTQGLIFEDIGKALNEPLNTVKSRHRRALKALREILERRTKNEGIDV